MTQDSNIWSVISIVLMIIGPIIAAAVAIVPEIINERERARGEEALTLKRKAFERSNQKTY